MISEQTKCRFWGKAGGGGGGAGEVKQNMTKGLSGPTGWNYLCWFWKFFLRSDGRGWRFVSRGAERRK